MMITADSLEDDLEVGPETTNSGIDASRAGAEGRGLFLGLTCSNELVQ